MAENKINVSFKESRRYLQFYLLSLLIFAIPLLFNYLFIKNCGELLTSEEIFKKQNDGKTVHLYGFYLFDNIAEIKIFALKNKGPAIISFGSSRALQFRESFFSKPFYNMGYTASSVDKALKMAQHIVTVSKPRVVLLGVDFWWFNEQYNKPIRDNISIIKPNIFSLSHIFEPFWWLYNNRISYRDYFNLFKSSAMPHIGVLAKYKQTGFAKDGSNYYIYTITNVNASSTDKGFWSTLSSIRAGADRFGHASEASDFHFNNFLKVIKIFEDQGIKVILFFPPLASTIIKEMKKYDYSYIDDLKEKFKKTGIVVADFTDAQKLLETTDCEFIDGFHGGDVLYAKILKYLAEHEPSLSEFVNKKALNKIIDSYSGLAMIPNPNITNKAEIDFLCLGCLKQIKGIKK